MSPVVQHRTSPPSSIPYADDQPTSHQPPTGATERDLLLHGTRAHAYVRGDARLRVLAYVYACVVQRGGWVGGGSGGGGGGGGVACSSGLCVLCYVGLKAWKGRGGEGEEVGLDGAEFF